MLFCSVMHLAPVSLPAIVGSSNGSPKLPLLVGSAAAAAFSVLSAGPRLGASASCAHAAVPASNRTPTTPTGSPRLTAGETTPSDERLAPQEIAERLASQAN